MKPPLHLATRSDAQANRERLLEAAEAVFCERGTAAEMKEIADRAGLGMGTIYRNFATKNDLMAAVIAAAVGSVAAAIEAAEEESDPIQGIRTFISRALICVERYGSIINSFLTGNVPPGCLERFGDARVAPRLAAIIQRGIQAGDFRQDLDPLVAAGYVHSLSVPWVYLELRHERSTEEISSGYVELALRALIAERSTAAN